MIKVAVIGVGSMGTHHARIFSQLHGVDLVGVVDTDFDRARAVAERYGCRAYRKHSEVVGIVDTASIAVPTTMHFSVSMDFLRRKKDIFIEKPITSSLKEADAIISEAEKRRLIVQVGHLERFNAGVTLVSRMVKAPRLIESSRLSPFAGRGTDVDVTLDLMIHDIDIILTLVKSEISVLRATGSRVLTNNIDVAYAWIEFKNGCSAEVVASRIADKKIRQLKIFQHNVSLTLDYLTQEVVSYRKVRGGVKRQLKKPGETEPLKEQLKDFIACVKKRKSPMVSAVEGKKALQVALYISDMINRHGSKTVIT